MQTAERTAPTVSVALTACNSGRYLEEQVASILPQLRTGDELIISVDPSTDDTPELVRQLARQHPAIKALEGPGRGVQANFEQAIAATTGDFIFLSDGDDVWLSTKVSEVLEAFEVPARSPARPPAHSPARPLLVLHDAEVVDEKLATLEPSFFQTRGSRPGYWRNIVKNSYIGCCMAFRRELVPYILPFPPEIPMHDQWIGLQAERHGSVCFLNSPLLKYRRHAHNLTAQTHASPLQMLAWRKNLIFALRQH